MKKSLFILFFIFISKNIYSTELQKERTFDLRVGSEINTTLGNRFEAEAKYELILDKHWQISPGILLAPGWSYLSAYHIETGFYQLFLPALSIHVKFLNRYYHDISVAENSIIPYLSWRDKYFEADFGVNVRFTNFGPDNLNLIFYYPKNLVQPFFTFRVAAYYVWEKPAIRLGLEIKNTDWNYSGNSFELSYHIDGVYQITKVWGIKINLGVTPSGIGGISVVYNRFNFLAGAQYRL